MIIMIAAIKMNMHTIDSNDMGYYSMYKATSDNMSMSENFT